MNESQIFNKALLLATPAERSAYLDAACGNNPQMRADVEALLKVYANAPNFLETPAPAASDIVSESQLERAGVIIGPYKLLQEIGEGGMGTVFMAEQTEPVKRKVALKIIKPGMDSRQVIARFEAERQALAMMDHPNIAKVFDGGTTGEPSRVSDRVLPDDETRRLTPHGSPGRPYFVMELVKGVPITKYCDDNNLTPKERLELFIPVCHAVQHAHQKGIIHRDLKPSNVMVACYDDRPVPKIIDFGIARATEQKLTERTLFTQFGQLVGTLEYMSPEQAKLNAQDIDTRSDIYSLGVLLYELLTGSTPLDKKRIKETPFDEVLRIIREDEAPTPSTRLMSTAELPSIAAQRKTEPAKLSRLVRGDLDWIALKALDKDRNRRYETANAFAEDIQRHLADEPVLARRPTTAYRLRKFARRYRGSLSVAVVVAVLLLALVGGVGWVIRDRGARHGDIARRAQDAMSAAGALLHENQPDLAGQRLDVAKGLIGDDRAVFAGLASEIDAFEVDLTRYKRFLELIEKGHKPHGPNERTSEFAFLIEAMHCYEVLKRDDWPARLEQSVLGKNQVKQIRDTVYEELLWLANAGLVFRAADLRVKLQTSHEAAAESTLRYLRAAEQARPATHGLYAMRAECHAILKNEKEARADEERARQTPPTMAIDLYHKGDIAFHSGDRELALKSFEAASNVEPSNFWSMFMQGQCLKDEKKGPDNIRAAVVAFTGCIMKRPDYPLAYGGRAEAYRRLGRFQEALVDGNKAIELYPGALTWSERGSTYEQLALWDKAIDDYVTALEYDLSADSFQAFLSLLRLRRKLMQPEMAIADLDKIIIRHSTWLDPLDVQAQLYEKLGQWEMAIVDYSKIIASAPQSAPAYLSRAIAFAALHKENEALADLSQAIVNNKKFVLNWISVLRLRQSQSEKLFEKALVELNQAILLDQKDADAHNILAFFVAIHRDPKRNDLARGLELAEKAVFLRPDMDGYWNTLGILRYRAGEWQAALDALIKGGRKTNDSFNWFYLAMAHWKLEHKEEALKVYRRAAQWMDDNKQIPPLQEELRGYRADAAKLLGIADEPKEQK